MERLIEDHALILPGDENRVQGPVEVPAVGDTDILHRPQSPQDLARPDRHACRPQDPGEMHDVGG